MAIPKRIEERIKTQLKVFQGILEAQRARDVSEADTVTVVKDILSEVFGYDKYAEVTSEHAIRGTYCDLAIQFDGKIQMLIEVKAIGINLNDRHVKQAIDYAANQGVDWVVLTNGIVWVLYHVVFKKPIDKEEVARLDLLEMDPRKEDSLDRLFLLTKRGVTKDALDEYRERQSATSRFMLAAILVGSDGVLSAIRREVRAVSDMLVDKEHIEKVLRDQVIKREAFEGEEAAAALQRLKKATRKRTRKSPSSASESDTTEPIAGKTNPGATPKPE